MKTITFILFDFYNVLYFPREDRLNAEIVKFIEKNDKKYRYGILTAVNTDLSSWLKERKIDTYFEFVKTSAELQMSKTEPGIYETVVNGLQLKPSAVLLIDDLTENISAASSAGLATLKYIKSKPFETQLKESINSN